VCCEVDRFGKDLLQKDPSFEFLYRVKSFHAVSVADKLMEISPILSESVTIRNENESILPANCQSPTCAQWYSTHCIEITCAPSSPPIGKTGLSEYFTLFFSSMSTATFEEFRMINGRPRTVTDTISPWSYNQSNVQWKYRISELP
jgi:hypothetical protein